MHVQIRDNEGDIACMLPPKFVDELQSAFSSATPEPNPLNWEVVGTVTYRRDGKDREAKLLWISQRECGLRMSIKEYWRGAPYDSVRDIVRRCAAEQTEVSK